MSRSLELYLEDMTEAIRKIYVYTNRMDYTQFCRDEKTVDAVIRNLIVIGEAVKNIPEDIRKTAPEVEWRKIAGLRDFAAHAYFNVSNEIIWDVVQNKLSLLHEAVINIQNRK